MCAVEYKRCYLDCRQGDCALYCCVACTAVLLCRQADCACIAMLRVLMYCCVGRLIVLVLLCLAFM
jgi:hypothetical protein